MYEPDGSLTSQALLCFIQHFIFHCSLNGLVDRLVSYLLTVILTQYFADKHTLAPVFSLVHFHLPMNVY